MHAVFAIIIALSLPKVVCIATNDVHQCAANPNKKWNEKAQVDGI